MKVRLIALFLFLYSLGYANPILNINIEDKIIYDNILSSAYSKNHILSIQPLSYYYATLSQYPDRVKPVANAFDKVGWYLKPINTVKVEAFYTNADYMLLEGRSGLSLSKGLNLFSFEDGYISLGKKTVFYYQLKQTLNKDLSKNEFFRAYIKFLIGKFAFELGKDNVNWGPGEYGLLLSNNAPPYLLVKMETDRPLNFFGKWKFSFVRGWLREDRKDVSNPNLLGLRAVWKPASFIEIGGTKTVMFGGDGRPGYKLQEYVELITSTKDNIPGSKYDNDSLAAYEISLFLPVKYFDLFKVYYQEAGSDVAGFWQEEDRGELKGRFPFIFMLLKPAYQFGFLISKGSNIFRLEYAYTSRYFYIHHWYNYEGYTYKGFSLGYPYGRETHSLFVKLTHYFDNGSWAVFKTSGYLQPVEEDNKQKRYYVSFEYSKFLRSSVEIKPYIRLDYVDNYDRNELPTQFDITMKTKLFTTLGLSVSLRF